MDRKCDNIDKDKGRTKDTPMMWLVGELYDVSVKGHVLKLNDIWTDNAPSVMNRVHQYLHHTKAGDAPLSKGKNTC